MASALQSRLHRLERSSLPDAVLVYAFGAGEQSELDQLLATAPDLDQSAVASVVWFQFGADRLHIIWGPVGRAWRDDRREWHGKSHEQLAAL